MDRTASHYRTLVSRDKYRYIGILRCFVLRYWIDIQKQCYRFFYWEFTCIYCVFLLCVAIQTPAASFYRFHYDGKTRSRNNTGRAVEASILPNQRSGPVDVWQTVLAHWWQKRRGHSWPQQLSKQMCGLLLDLGQNKAVKTLTRATKSVKSAPPQSNTQVTQIYEYHSNVASNANLKTTSNFDSCNKTSAVSTCFYLRCLSAVENKGFGDMITTLEPRYTVSPETISQTSLSKVVPRSHSDSPGLSAQQRQLLGLRDHSSSHTDPWSLQSQTNKLPFSGCTKSVPLVDMAGLLLLALYIVYLDEFFKQFHFSCIFVYVKVT